MNKTFLPEWFYHPLFAPILLIVLAIFPLATWLLLPLETAEFVADRVIDHDGFVAVTYCLVMWVLYKCRPKDNTLKENISFWIFEILTLCAMLREFGIQHMLTKTDSTAFKIRFFLNPNNPIGEKVLAGLILLVVFGMGIFLMIRYTRFLIQQFFRFQTLAWTTATFCFCVLLAKFFDRFPDNYKRFTGQSLIYFWDVGRACFEEFYEGYIPLFIIILAIQFARLRIRVDR